jgi:chloramphenicol O-acetyltransferase
MRDETLEDMNSEGIKQDIEGINEGINEGTKAGKYECENGKLVMPLTMQIHHAVADSFHTARFFKDVEDEINKIIRL